MRNQDRPSPIQPPQGTRREDRSDDATEAGGGNLHRGRGATAWGREEGGDDATEAGGGNLHRGRGATAWGREEEGGDDTTEAGVGQPPQGTGSHCLGPRRSNSDLPIYQDLEAFLYQKRR